MNFVAIDVEAANADMASVCSIGAVRFENGRVADEWYSLVDPHDYFDDITSQYKALTKRWCVVQRAGQVADCAHRPQDRAAVRRGRGRAGRVLWAAAPARQQGRGVD